MIYFVVKRLFLSVVFSFGCIILIGQSQKEYQAILNEIVQAKSFQDYRQSHRIFSTKIWILDNGIIPHGTKIYAGDYEANVWTKQEAFIAAVIPALKFNYIKLTDNKLRCTYSYSSLIGMLKFARENDNWKLVKIRHFKE